MTWRSLAVGALATASVAAGIVISRQASDTIVAEPAPAATLDPQKGRWGGRSADPSGFALTARITPVVGRDDIFEMRLRVKAPPGADYSGTPVTFHLHPSFEPSVVRTVVRDGAAELVRSGWSASTVGAIVETRSGPIHLELDLAGLSDAPRRFRER